MVEVVRIKEYPNYDIYSDGRVYSYNRDQFLRLSKVRGYVKVRLFKDSVGKTFYMHQLVAKHFLGDLSDTLDVCHADGNKENNDVSNLRWDTRKENTADLIRAGNHVNKRKTHCAQGHEYNAENTVYYKSHPTWRKCKECDRLGSKRYREKVK